MLVRISSHQRMSFMISSGGSSPFLPSPRYQSDQSVQWHSSQLLCMGTYQNGSRGKRMSLARSACQRVMSIMLARARVAWRLEFICLRLMFSPTARQ